MNPYNPSTDGDSPGVLIEVVLNGELNKDDIP
jgi:hypothetical protein